MIVHLLSKTDLIKAGSLMPFRISGQPKRTQIFPWKVECKCHAALTRSSAYSAVPTSERSMAELRITMLPTTIVPFAARRMKVVASSQSQPFSTLTILTQPPLTAGSTSGKFWSASMKTWADPPPSTPPRSKTVCGLLLQFLPGSLARSFNVATDRLVY